MTRQLRMAAVVAALLMTACFWPGRGEALTFDLNCIIGNSSCSSSASYGTLTLTANTSGANTAVDIKVDLVGPGDGTPGSGQKVLNLFLNFNDSLFSNTDVFQLTSTKTVGVGENDRRLPPFQTGSSGGFDLEITATGNINEFEPYLDTLFIAGRDLLPGDLAFKDSTGVLFAGLHIGNCDKLGGSLNDCDPGILGEGSIKVGAPGDPLTPVPEPATLLLFGTTAAALGLLKHRRRRTRD
jgi:PEP-CTERM motif-containing protein